VTAAVKAEVTHSFNDLSNQIPHSAPYADALTKGARFEDACNIYIAFSPSSCCSQLVESLSKRVLEKLWLFRTTIEPFNS